MRRDGRETFTARRDSDASGGDLVAGYLYTSADHPWPGDPAVAIREGRLPDSWIDATRAEHGQEAEVVLGREKHLPQETRAAAMPI